MGKRPGRTATRATALANVDLRLLRVFLKVAQAGGFAAAEVSLNKARSAISVDIANLETRLGVRLCERGPGGFQLTPQGTAILQAAKALFADIDRFADRVDTITNHLSGRLTLMTIDNIGSVAADQMVAALRTFRITHPDVELVLRSGSAPEVEQAIVDGSAHLGISLLPRMIGELETVSLFSEELLLFCGWPHPLFDLPDDAITPEALACQTVMMPSTIDAANPGSFLAGFQSGPVAWNLDSLVLMILAGVDMGFLPQHFAQKWVDQGQIRSIRPDSLSISNMFYLFARRDAGRSPATTAMMAIIEHCFAPAGHHAGRENNRIP
jgi:DNA-binding transcriptional LysR family regulator